jgi:hypothetical protein
MALGGRSYKAGESPAKGSLPLHPCAGYAGTNV